MNDFTKEELQDLECWLRVTRKQDITLPSDKNKEYILDKLQSMIDNYCEHEKEGSVGLHNLCLKCGWIGI